MPKKGDPILFLRGVNYETTKGRRRFAKGSIHSDLSAADLKPLGKEHDDTKNPKGAYRVATVAEVENLTPKTPVSAVKLASLGGSRHGIIDADGKRIEIAQTAQLAEARVKELNETHGDAPADDETDAD